MFKISHNVLQISKKSQYQIFFKNSRCVIGAVLNTSYSTTADQDLLHTSIVPTYYFQKSLPRLPIPKLEDTCSRYLMSQRVILSDSEYAQTEKLVKEFESGEGKSLHEALKTHDKQNKHTSYISGPWFDMYLKDRVPLVLNYNPFMAFTHDPKPEYNDQLIRGTNMIVSSMRFMKTLQACVLEPEIFHLNPKVSDTEKFRKFIRKVPEFIAWYGAYWYKAFPLDMSQYGRLFSSTRIPRLGKDELYTNPNCKHLLVMRNGHFYTFDVLDSNGDIKSATEIMAYLKYIIQDNTPAPDHPLGFLTSENRDVWAQLRDKLIEAGNTEQLNAIDGAAFNLILDNNETDNLHELSKSFLYGDAGNRWFDKSFSVILTKSGKAAVNFEHAWGDGVAVLRYFNEVFKDTTEKPKVHPDTVPANVDCAAAVRKLDFNLTDELKAAIQNAKTGFEKTTSSLDLNFLECNKFGKNFLKQQKISPDSFMQLLVQMAYHRQYDDTAATYESCSTAAFRHGRTETIRSATAATKKTCDMMRNNSTASLAEIRASIEECSKVHGELTKNAAMGQGFDRHLFGLRHTAQKMGDVPAIFQDPAYAKINHVILSTSTLSSPAVIIGGFAPVVPDGYGIGYAIEDEQLGFVVTSYPTRNTTDFLNSAQSCVDDLYKVLNGEDFRK